MGFNDFVSNSKRIGIQLTGLMITELEITWKEIVVG
jgi:hypothetical protein